MSVVSGIAAIEGGGFGPSDIAGTAEFAAPGSIARLEQALDLARGQAEVPRGGTEVAQAGTATDARASDPEVRERALRALGFEPVEPVGPSQPPTATTGDTILEGLKHLRGAFDEQTSNLNRMNADGAMSSGEMLALQVEVVKYGLLIDVTSKLTGKSTQAFDTLLKGQ